MQVFIKFATKFDEVFNANFLYVKVYFEIFDVEKMLRLEKECKQEDIRMNTLDQLKF